MKVPRGGAERRRLLGAGCPLRPDRDRRARRPDRALLRPDAERLHRTRARTGRQTQTALAVG